MKIVSPNISAPKGKVLIVELSRIRRNEALFFTSEDVFIHNEDGTVVSIDGRSDFDGRNSSSDLFVVLPLIRARLSNVDLTAEDVYVLQQDLLTSVITVDNKSKKRVRPNKLIRHNKNTRLVIAGQRRKKHRITKEKLRTAMSLLEGRFGVNLESHGNFNFQEPCSSRQADERDRIRELEMRSRQETEARLQQEDRDARLREFAGSFSDPLGLSIPLGTEESPNESDVEHGEQEDDDGNRED